VGSSYGMVRAIPCIVRALRPSVALLKPFIIIIIPKGVEDWAGIITANHIWLVWMDRVSMFKVYIWPKFFILEIDSL